MATMKFQKNQHYQGQVADLNTQGAGVVKIDGFPFFVEGVIPGEEIAFKATKVKKNYGFGRLEKIITISPDRVELKDDLGRQIGTMTLQHMNYSSQLAYKQKVVKDAFQRLGHFDDIEVAPTLASDRQWQYRNKAQIPVRALKGQLQTGFFRKNSHDLVAVEDFHIQEPDIDRAILLVRDLLRQYQISPYNEADHLGDIRHIIIKRGYYSKEMMVVLVTRQKQVKGLQNLAEAIAKALPEVVSIMQNIQDQRTNVIMGRDNHCLWGQDYLEDEMLGNRLRISAHSFYQVNTPQAEKLYQVGIDYAQLSGQEKVLDAYCGIGSISLALAKHAKEVYAMEIVPEAIEMAKQNAQLNHIDNVHFQAGPAETILPQWQSNGIHFDVAVVDPPRKGLDSQFIQTLVELCPDRIVYISCNPASCARDCRQFADVGYQVQTVQPVDMFPQTVHVECVVLMQKVKE
ncbi:23S rRNA (uracil(1939)-C(5))-methyltransferase RlmD [Ignavigranum ruoffiae]|uniref:23S rRNA (uracil(1939)-C(5))-methyltransferase RlmD n=1 Tax=Ignavigranum ruoffiae TaxID=89093 RepID=UPI002877B500|nr:23S rRNA (uracil(1939)-C(5))-methyltransferase RlmD [Ignavigranum ruoffiae]